MTTEAPGVVRWFPPSPNGSLSSTWHAPLPDAPWAAPAAAEADENGLGEVMYDLRYCQLREHE
jgi:hypothetical protein